MGLLFALALKMMYNSIKKIFTKMSGFAFPIRIIYERSFKQESEGSEKECRITISKTACASIEALFSEQRCAL